MGGRVDWLIDRLVGVLDWFGCLVGGLIVFASVCWALGFFFFNYYWLGDWLVAWGRGDVRHGARVRSWLVVAVEVGRGRGGGGVGWFVFSPAWWLSKMFVLRGLLRVRGKADGVFSRVVGTVGVVDREGFSI